MELKIGFTGTRKGMTEQQIKSFNSIIKNKKPNNNVILIHGDCIGADADAHVLALNEKIEIIKRPSNLYNQRAFTIGGSIIANPEPPLDRNKKIVDDCLLLIACPETFVELQRSGTWSTIRYAKRQLKDIIIIRPDGTLSYIMEGVEN